MADPLPDPAVSPDVYTDEYFRHACGGSDEWSRSGGCEVGGIYAAILDRAGFRAGQVVVDLGTGRGELLAVAAERGAERAVGVEYAEAAVALARQTLEVHDVSDRAEVILADARAIPLDDGIADLVTMLDVVEHLAPPELDRALREAHRLLKPGGRLEIHTAPTRTLYNVTYRLQRLARPSRWKRWPANPRNEFERRMHVNEQSLWGLRRALRRAGFARPRVEAGMWVYTDFVPDQRAHHLYRALARRPVTRPFGSSNLFASATKAVR